MGVITDIPHDVLVESLLENYGLESIRICPTNEGISDTTYKIFGTDGKVYLLKIYESADENQAKRETELLIVLVQNYFPVPKVYPVTSDTEQHLLSIYDKPVSLFSYLVGENPVKIKSYHIKEIASFLGKFHQFTYGENNGRDNIYSKDRIKYYLSTAKRLEDECNVSDIYDSVNGLEYHGIIHGDLFPDNTHFKEKRLSGVFDFTGSCQGSFYFDLAVVAISWCFEGDCFNRTLFDTLLCEYCTQFQMLTISIPQIANWMKFASLFYASQRLYMEMNHRLPDLTHHSSQEYFKKLTILRSLF